VLLLWLSHLVLAPFDLSTISSKNDDIYDFPILQSSTIELSKLPQLSKQLLALGITYLTSPGNRERDAAALLLIRLSLRRDMRSLGLLDAMVKWGIQVVTELTVDPSNATHSLFLKTGFLTVLAGLLAQGDSEAVRKFAPRMLETVTSLQDSDSDEWNSSGVRRLGIKIYRWVSILTLTDLTEIKEGIIEDIIERLLSSLGDRDTAVRFGASKSLAVIASKLEPDMAGDVLEAVMNIYNEDVFFDPPISKPGKLQKRVLAAVSPEKWHGATLTLATFLRQRAVRSIEAMKRVVECIVEALSFEQRRSTFAVGGNVRDAACYATWSLARSYTTKELLDGGETVVSATGFEESRKIIQILATELVVTGCTDPLGNVRRASSAALQELVGRHHGCIAEGIPLVQVMDYSAVALRQRSVLSVANHAAMLQEQYWRGIAMGLVNGWRGVGSNDEEGRKLAATSLGMMVGVYFGGERSDNTSIQQRGHYIFRLIMRRLKNEGQGQIETYHGCLLALAEVLDGLSHLSQPQTILSREDQDALHGEIFSNLKGNEFTNPVLQPGITAVATCRLVQSLAKHCPIFLDFRISSFRLWTAIVEASLDRPEATVLDEAVRAVREILEKLSSSNIHGLVDSWSRKITDAACSRRGHILAIGEAFSSTPDDKLDLRKLTDTLIAAARQKNEVEIRVAGVRALAKIRIFEETVMETILHSLDDYAIDARGDVGSWVRSEAVTAVFAHWKDTQLLNISSNLRWALTSKLVRLSVEKLDRLRYRASEVLLAVSKPVPSFSNVFPQTYQESIKTALQGTAQEYFATLLPLLAIPEVREGFIEGFVTSAGAGSSSVLKASRRALLEYLSSTAICASTNCDFAASLVIVFRKAVAAANDRIVVPMLEVVSLLLDTAVFLPNIHTARVLFILTQKSHFKSTNFNKLLSAVRVYRSLALCITHQEPHLLRGEIVNKLVSMLMHPFLLKMN
jgi:hypothetical protein